MHRLGSVLLLRALGWPAGWTVDWKRILLRLVIKNKWTETLKRICFIFKYYVQTTECRQWLLYQCYGQAVSALNGIIYV